MYCFDLYSRFRYSSERCRLPVCLRAFFPHHCIKLVIVLVTEHKAYVVVINVGVHEECTFKVDATERVVT